VELCRAGASAAESPRDVAVASDIVIVIVSDSPDVKEVVAGPGGILEGVREGSIVVDMSTISTPAERELNALLEEKGARLVDAPVSGGDVGAHSATLSIMAGGDKKAFERVTPVLEVMGKSITYCGPVGSGQLTKLCNQILVSLNLLAVSEALAFARKSGLNLHTMVEAVKGGAAGSWQLANLGPKIVDRDFAPGFMIDLIQKDLRLVFENAEAVGVPLPGTALMRQLFQSAQNAGYGSEGTQAVAQILEELAGVVKTTDPTGM